MKTETAETIQKKTSIAYHQLALGLWTGLAKSRGKSIQEEVIEYMRTLSKTDNGWRNILKTKEQKNIAVSRMSDMFANEFGLDGVSKFIFNGKESANV